MKKNLLDKLAFYTCLVLSTMIRHSLFLRKSNSEACKVMCVHDVPSRSRLNCQPFWSLNTLKFWSVVQSRYMRVRDWSLRGLASRAVDDQLSKNIKNMWRLLSTRLRHSFQEKKRKFLKWNKYTISSQTFWRQISFRSRDIQSCSLDQKSGFNRFLGWILRKDYFFSLVRATCSK